MFVQNSGLVARQGDCQIVSVNLYWQCCYLKLIFPVNLFQIFSLSSKFFEISIAKSKTLLVSQ